MLKPVILEVKTFGEFSITRQTDAGTLSISEHDSFSRKLWGLLEYLIIFRKHGVTRAELIDAFWGEDCSGNLDNNLKALIFRARGMMSALDFPFGRDVIIYKNNSYRFGPALAFHVDAEEFETLCRAADNARDPNERLENVLSALRLYDGGFLTRSKDFSWAATLNIYYHSKYLKLCASAISLLAQAERHEEIITLCKKALTIDPFDEMLHRSLIEAFVDSGATKAAMEHYTYVIDLFIRGLSVSPSNQLTALYHKIASAVSATEQDLHSVRDKLQECEENVEPFFCGYATFRDIYRLEARAAKRSGEPVQLLMLTLSGLNSKALSSGQIRSGMAYLMQAIRSTLRMSDVFCQYSAVQYLLLLSSASCENAEKAVDRVLQYFHTQHPKVSYTVKYALLPVLPNENIRCKLVPESNPVLL